MHAPNTDDGSFEIPAEAQGGFEDDVAEMIFRLGHAGRGHDFAFTMDMVLLALERLALGPATQRISDGDFLRVGDALTRAAEAGYERPPVGMTREQTAEGLWLVAHALAYWRLPEDQRRAKAKWKSTLRQALRVFRNALHNSCLLVNIADVVREMQALPLPSVFAEFPRHPDLLDLPRADLTRFTSAFSAAS